MADPNFFPGFEGDDEPAKPAKPEAKPAAAPAKPAFDPFAGAKVDTKAAAAPPPAAAPGKPGTNRVAKAPAPAAAPPPPPPPADADADLKPGSRKDLWKCPHCGAGNKPDRDTCRTCGKSPDEPVVIPWYKNNVIRAGILAVIGLVIIGIVMLTRVDVSLREPTLANVDKAPRITGKGIASIDLGNGIKLEGERMISICGRVAAVGTGPGGTQLVALALGAAAADEKPSAPPANGSFDVAGVVLACSAEDNFDPKPGQIISLTGVVGVLVKEGRIVDEPTGIIPVAVGEHLTAKP
jgi:hypothetical protein